MQKKSILIWLLAVTLLLSSCNLINFDQERVVDSRLISTEDTPEINSPTVGIVWTKNTKDTNISEFYAGNENGSSIDDPCVVKVGDTYHLWFTGVQNIFGQVYYTIRYARSSDGINWSSNNDSNIALTPNTLPNPDDHTSDSNGVRVGSVIWDKEEKEFKMWYLGRHTDNKWRVFYAASKSPDRGWLRYPNDQHQSGQLPKPVLTEGVKYDREIEGVSVIKERYFDGISHHSYYKMWYSGLGDVDLTKILTDCKYRINYAGSQDGVTWTKNKVPVLEDYAGKFDSNGMIQPVVIKDLMGSVDTYKLWYLGGTPGNQASLKPGLAYSAITGEQFGYYKVDLQVITDPNDDSYESLPEVPAGLDSPVIIRDGYVYKMWYIRQDNNRSILSYVESW